MTKPVNRPHLKRGRRPGFKMPEEHRGKIRQAAILNALQEHVIGTRPMQQTQVTAATVLLRKVMPDLTSTALSGDADNPVTLRTIVIDTGSADK